MCVMVVRYSIVYDGVVGCTVPNDMVWYLVTLALGAPSTKQGRYCSVVAQ